MSASSEDIVRSTRNIAGTGLIGVKGKTPEDQEGVDVTVTRFCATGVYTKPECRRHQLLTGAAQ